MKLVLLVWAIVFSNLISAQGLPSKTNAPKGKSPTAIHQLENAIQALDSALCITFNKMEVAATDSVHLVKLKKNVVQLNKTVSENATRIGRELEKIATEIDRQLNKLDN